MRGGPRLEGAVLGRGANRVIDKLEYLLALSRERHFGRAAAACGISQPTLSAALKQMEETLGVLLVNRGSRFQDFTPEGQRVLDWARRIVADARTMREELRAARAGLTGHLRLAAVPSALATVSQLTTPFRARHPGVTFTVNSRSTGDILTELENLELDAALGYVTPELGRARTVPLYREHYCLVVAATHAVASQPEVRWEDIPDLPFCLLGTEMQNRRILDAKLRAAGHVVRPGLESNSVTLLLSHVQTGEWASILPRAMILGFQLPAVVRPVPIVGSGDSPLIGLIYPQREPLPPLVAAFVAEARRLTLLA
jgi:DNA-binding transcriptional LysR family regulator